MVQFIITWVQTYVNPTAPFYQCERGIWGYVHGIIQFYLGADLCETYCPFVPA